jgi:hypothetical protein
LIYSFSFSFILFFCFKSVCVSVCFTTDWVLNTWKNEERIIERKKMKEVVTRTTVGKDGSMQLANIYIYLS